MYISAQAMCDGLVPLELSGIHGNACTHYWFKHVLIGCKDAGALELFYVFTPWCGMCRLKSALRNTHSLQLLLLQNKALKTLRSINSQGVVSLLVVLMALIIEGSASQYNLGQVDGAQTSH